MTGTAPRALARNQVAYFSHEAMRFFAENLLQLGYEELRPEQDVRDAFRFDPAARVISRPSDWLTPLALHDTTSVPGEARRVAGFLARRLRHGTSAPPLFRIPGLATCGMVVHPRDQTHVVVQRRPRAVWKLVKDARDTRVIENERAAARLAPGFAAAVLDVRLPGPASPGWLSLEHVMDTQPIAAGELPAALRQITRELVETYSKAGIEVATAAATLAEVAAAERAIRLRADAPFTAFAADVLTRIGRALEPFGDCRAVYTELGHGDIQRSNLRRSGGRIRLIDWANGGRCHVLHDAFIVELFAPTASVWSEILVSGKVDPERGFHGWLPAVLDELSDVLKVRLSAAEVAAGLVCSMAEKALRVIDRFAGADEERGMQSLGRIQALWSPRTL